MDHPDFLAKLAEETELLRPLFVSADQISGGTLHIHQPPVQSVLRLTNDVIRIESSKPVPNVWVRFWHRALLGWRWESL